ncbi:TetR/AcrR family transcriptional regulator [Novosphingobium sp. Fuku2-ISO-50]|uniref:TetR/AcrR family transcriptional regulator n=1 Tax=Novosphingobium sp. Fuku2-ISO-50 TaxID=1739114 RepID=UPI00076C3090|nr:TetR/AcrR family transcriptional regulator [Novosphingobium sp. Fuku2-ISO-50]KUR76714.1 TetR family transcriptional regulator [Novosphingobium sp. Fuku2-ISO-50]
MKLTDARIDEAALPEAELSPSVIRILSGALDAIAARGTKRLSMSDIIDASGVSRGTLYRYFSNKDQVLAAVAEFVCTGFESGIREAGKGIDDPIERLRAVMQFYDRYTDENSPGRIFEVEPAFHLAFFRSRFGRYKQAVLDALDPTFDYLDRLLGEPLQRDAFAELLVRTQLSTLLIPADNEWKQLWNGSADRVRKWALTIAAARN